ncbi:MAG: hypothetical protein ACREF6_17105 [Alphaproteobacteria bacterium]
MQINGSIPVHPSATDIGSAGLQADPRKPAPVAGEQTQTGTAVKPSDKGEAASGDDTGSANRQGRGQLLDIKV